MKTKLKYFLDNANVFSMLEIQKYRNKTYQKDRYSPSEMQCFSLDLLWTEVLATIV